MIISRRSFIKASLATSAVAAGGSSGCGNDVAVPQVADVTVDDVASSDHYGQIAIPVAQYSQLQASGGALTLRIAALPAGNRPYTVPAGGVLLVHRGSAADQPEFIATRADCPHQGCPLGYSAKDQQIECPCHGSRFRAIADTNDKSLCVGLVTHLPARSNLSVYAANRVGDVVYVDLRSDLSCDALAGIPSVVDGKVTVPLALYPALAAVGGTVVGRPTGLADKLIIARVAQDKVVALSSICTHLQCDVALSLPAQRFECPCHGSNFAYDGAVLAPPAAIPLKSYSVTFDGTTVVVTV